MKDLVILVADKNMEYSVKGILSRPQALSIRQISFDLFVHPHNDPGCLNDGHHFLQPSLNQNPHALILFDREGCGREGLTRQQLEQQVETNLFRAGWQQAAAIVLDPELEIWVWSDSPHVAEILGWKNKPLELDRWLKNKGFLHEGESKPISPKECMEAVLRQVRKPRSSYIDDWLRKSVLGVAQMTHLTSSKPHCKAGFHDKRKFMTVEVRPLGVKCNLQCLYCYENPQRDAKNVLHSYDIEKMKEGIEREGRSFTLFGGDALLVPKKDLEELWSWGFQKYERNGIQTNGTLIDDDHIRMFKQYNVHVGISVDGPRELNDVRWAGTLKNTRKATAKTHAAIDRLRQEKISVGLIVTLHRGNATKDKLPVMHDWFRHLESIGIKSARLHILEVEDELIRQKYALSAKENIDAFLSLLKLEEELTTFKFDMFEDMRNMLLGQDKKSTCLWKGCDPYTTRSVQGIEGNGQRSNCGRIHKDGIDFVKAGVEGFERYLALYQTPQEYSGCEDCRFFLMCKGECPGSAIDGDWRNRTEHCEVLKGLFEFLEKNMLEEGVTPLSVHHHRQQIEKSVLDAWETSRNTNIADIIAQFNKENESISA